MIESNFFRVECLTRQSKMFGNICIFLFISVCIVSNNWIPEKSHMNTNLVHTSGMNLDFYFAYLCISNCPFTEYLVIRQSWLSFWVDTNFVFVFGVFDSEKFCVDFPSGVRKFSKYQCSIVFLNIGMFPEIFGKFRENMFLLGNHDDS